MKPSIVLACMLLSNLAMAQDRLFGQIYTSELLEKGTIEMELWHTSRFGHESQFFHGMDQRIKLEAGLGERIQTALYFNRFQNTYSNAAEEVEHTSAVGFSNEWKLGLTRPGKLFGMAAYAEFSLMGDAMELEAKFIADRKFGKNILAGNLACRFDESIRRESGETRVETEGTPVELDLGYMRHLTPNLALGLELRDNNEVAEGHWENSVVYAGPTINYHQKHWFILANFLPQLGNLHKTDEYPGKKVLNVRERAEVRVMIGFSL